ncbi:MAG: class II aldolase/adducin family protein [Ignavibacteriae bacterium]|nr:class II aldolase/adducin family protein [Ignavibacteriota bacterium]
MKEGVIKFRCHWNKDKPLPLNILNDIIHWRNHLFSINFIGADNDGIGFGNLSIRYKDNQFIISGSQTSINEKADEKDFTLVTSFDIEKNLIQCKGPVKASSESLTHAAIYSVCKEANAVIHIHNLNLWEKLKNKVPTTPDYAEYGTPELAQEIIKLFETSDIINKNILVMGGHPEGIISFGRSLEEAIQVIENYL